MRQCFVSTNPGIQLRVVITGRSGRSESHYFHFLPELINLLVTDASKLVPLGLIDMQRENGIHVHRPSRGIDDARFSSAST